MSTPLVGDVTGLGSAMQGGASILSSLTGLISRFIPDKEKAEEAARAIQTELLRQQGEQNAGQIEINKVEAANPNLFVSGWRPFLGWVCGAALTWEYIVGPLVVYVAHLCGSQVQLPPLNTGDLLMLTANMLGLGAMHTWDKKNGTAPPSGTVITTKEVRRALPVER